MFTPQLVGLPPKFHHFFPGQEAAIGSILASTTRFDILPASTGFGKSATYMALALLYAKFGKRCLILTSNRGLQDQIDHDFESAGLVGIRGMRNYECVAMSRPGGEFFPFFVDFVIERGYMPGCDEGPCLAGYRCPHKIFGGCSYFDQVAKAQASAIKESNYSYWLRTGPDRLGPVDVLILDEAHDAPKQLSEALTLRISHWDLKMIHLDIPSINPNYDWPDWAKKTAPKVADRMENLKSRGRPLSYARDVRRLSELADKLDRLQKRQSDWIFKWDPKGILHWEPLLPAPYAESHLFRGAVKVILTSANVGLKHLELLDIKPEETTWHHAPNAFDPRRRPVYFLDLSPRVRVRYPFPDDQMDVIYGRVDHLISQRPRRKGIVHTVNYMLAQRLRANSRYRDLMIVPEKDTKNATRDAVAQYKASAPPRLLVSPAVYQGYDFPDAECRYQIILKFAFPESNDVISKARTDRDPEYKSFMAMMHLVQAVGRGMRNTNDWCETFILCDQARWFMPQYRYLAPDWFMAAYRVVSTFPVPLNPTAE